MIDNRIAEVFPHYVVLPELTLQNFKYFKEDRRLLFSFLLKFNISIAE